MIGRHIGRYRILEELGTGGMSVVYKGLDTALDREVAVKVLHPHLAGKEESRRRLAREAKAVAKLHHPNILEVFDFAGAETAEAYIVTEYIRGRTLRQCAAEQILTPPEVAAMVVAEIASALAHAHEAGIIHRDLKPENVMVREDGVLKLMDFGIAKIVDRDDRMTMTGALVGSPAHMAPEIIEGEEAGAEADVFSLGTMLYFFATGRLPFSGANTTATLKKILDGAYDDPRQVMPAVSDELAEIIATCLARQPSQRYAHAGKLRDALSEYLSALGLTRVGEELVSFFADPPSYRKQLIPKLTQALVKRGEDFLQQKRPAKALASLNQVLALQHDHPRALELLKQMNVSRQRQRRTAVGVRVAVAATVLVALGTGGAQAYRTLTQPPDFSPGGARLSEVMLPASLFPEAAPKAAPDEPKVETPPAAVPAKAVVSARKGPEDGKRVARVDAPVGAGRVKVEVHIEPYGSVKFDSGEASPAEARKMYEMMLVPGPHQVTVSCGPQCEDFTQTAMVPPMPEPGHQFPEIHVTARLKPSHVSFVYEPSSAEVEITLPDSAEFEGAAPGTRTLTRPVSETQQHPFVIHIKPGHSGVHAQYKVSSPGYKPEIGPLEVAAGETKTSKGNLEKK